MRTLAVTIGAAAVAAVAVASVALITDSDPIDEGAAALIAVGLMVAAVTCLSGLILARAPWGRWGLAAIVVLAVALAMAGGSALGWVALAVAAAALVGLLGPWLRLWTRHAPVADGPGPVPTALMAVAPIAPLFVGLAAATGAHWTHWLAAAVASVSAVLYAQGIQAGQWGLRVAVPIAAVAAAANTALVGAILLVVAGVAVASLAWLPAASRTTTVITAPLPPPVGRSRE